MIFLLGPTASGKSRLAMEVAHQVGGEIVSVDAFQIYRGMDIGTAKPKPEERQAIPHHLLDIVEPEDSFTAADYRREAEEALEELKKKKRPALWVGGTGLYHRVMTRGLSAAPRTDPKTAEKIEAMSMEEMVEEIQRVDPVWARSSDLQNRRRLVRALAVWRQSGRTMSDWQTHETKEGILAAARCYVLHPNIDDLVPVIRLRVERMLEEGWGEEVRGLLKREGWRGSPGSRAIGYGEVAQWVEGKMKKNELCDKIVASTRAYAKRQLTWFRGLPNTHSIEIDSHLAPSQRAAETLVQALLEST